MMFDRWSHHAYICTFNNLVTRKTEEHTCIVIINWYFLPTEKVCCACFAFSLFFVLKAVVLAWNRLSYHLYLTPHLRSRSQHHFHVIALSVELSWVGWQGCWALPCQLNVQAFLETREQYDLKDSNKQQYWLLTSTIKDFLRGEDKTWTRGPWTPTLDRVHGPLSWTGSMDPLSWTRFMDSFFNNEKWTKT